MTGSRPVPAHDVGQVPLFWRYTDTTSNDCCRRAPRQEEICSRQADCVLSSQKKDPSEWGSIRTVSQSSMWTRHSLVESEGHPKGHT